MKKFMTIVAVMMLAATACMAQSYTTLAKAQQEMDKLNKELAYPKPTSADKKEAKALKKEKWMIMAGEDAMEIQIHNSRLYGACLMADDDMAPTKRFILRTSAATSGTIDAAMSEAILSAQTQIALLIQTQLISAMEKGLDNAQSSAISAVTVDKFHQRAKAITEACLTNMLSPMTIYRVLPNNQYQVQVRVAYDKMELKRKLTKKIQNELEMEGDKRLIGIVDEAVSAINE